MKKNIIICYYILHLSRFSSYAPFIWWHISNVMSTNISIYSELHYINFIQIIHICNVHSDLSVCCRVGFCNHCKYISQLVIQSTTCLHRSPNIFLPFNVIHNLHQRLIMHQCLSPKTVATHSSLFVFGCQNSRVLLRVVLYLSFIRHHSQKMSNWLNEWFVI